MERQCIKGFLVFSIFLFFGFSKENKDNKSGQKENATNSLIAATPPMGWNSFQSYGVYLFEEAAIANLDAFYSKLKPYGYEYFVIDAGWFGEFELKKGTRYPTEKHAKKLNINEYGLLQPSKTYFPNGLIPIINRCHELGLKFGLHLMRGIPREAYQRNVTIKGTNFRAADITDTLSVCTWNAQNYGINMNKPGAQEFYNSLINQMAEWGVDFVKFDDIVPFPKEVEAVAKAIAQCRRPIVLSLSPGDRVPKTAIDFFKKANMLRVTHDIWDDQKGLDVCFKAWREWQGYERSGFWIDMDLIPFGQLQLMSPKPVNLSGKETREELIARKKKGELANVELLAGKGWTRYCELTKDQMYTFITLRALSASPLMLGGNIPNLDDFSLQLLTNAEMINCNQNGVMGKLVYEKDQIEIWQVAEKGSQNGWIGVFNRSAMKKLISLNKLAPFNEIRVGFSFQDVWNKRSIDLNNQVAINDNGVIFIRYSKLTARVSKRLLTNN